MIRPGFLAAAMVVAGSSHALAQQGGMMGGQRGQGGMMMQGGMGGMGGAVASAPASDEIQRSVLFELEGARRIEGELRIGRLQISSDIGHYAIKPDRVKTLHFLKPDADQASRSEMYQPPKVKVVLTSGQELTGTLDQPAQFRIDLEFGSLIPDSSRLRSITFVTATDKKGPPAVEPAQRARAAQPLTRSPEPQPRNYIRWGNHVIAHNPEGSRVWLVDLESGKSRTQELSGTREAPLEITPIFGSNLICLQLKGARITRIAVADTVTGEWHPQDLKEPVDGRVVPIVGQGFVVYSHGSYAYAFSAQSERWGWDVVKLPKGVNVGPVVSMNSATIEDGGHIFTFTPRTGKWQHIDVRAILDVIKEERK